MGIFMFFIRMRKVVVKDDDSIVEDLDEPP
jgi:hypothetical protein